jgi:hypothetical protein
MGYPPTRLSGQVNGLGVTFGSPANARGTAECGRSTAWGKAVCGRTACTVWEGGTGEVHARQDGIGTRRETDGTEPIRRTGFTEPVPYFTRGAAMP